MGKHYTKQEISQIQALTEQGCTIKQIAKALGRPEAGIRNIRHRKKLKTQTRQTLGALKQDEKILTKRVTRLRRDVKTLDLRRKAVQQALNTEEQTLDTKLQTALYKLRDLKPELFIITLQDQIGKMAAEISVNLLKWLVS